MTVRKTKPVLRVVQTPNLEEMERVLSDTLKQTAPMVSRASSTRQRFEAEVIALEAEREGVEARIALAQRHYEALMKGFQAEIADINGAIGFHTAGLTQDAMKAAE